MLLSTLFGGLAIATLVVGNPVHHQKRQWPICCANTTSTRVDFASMPPEDRQSYTNAIKCMMALPSGIDDITTYPAAISRYFDYAVIHVFFSQNIHISGYFLTWHRYFLYLFEKDLRNHCNYTGRFPYWNFGDTASSPSTSVVFDGSPYSMSGDGEYVDSGPIVLGPNFTLPHGTGGGCVTTGPFPNLSVPMKSIPIAFLRNGTLPADAYAYQPNCLSRDLNAYIASTYTNPSSIQAATHAPDAEALEVAMNGAIGSASLGIHSGAHFQVGGSAGQMSSIHVSPQDPIWFMMHTYVDLVYDRWQRNNPEVRDDVSGTMTANNVPPSEVVTLDSIMPGFGCLDESDIRVRDLLDIQAGPFCYEYDVQIS